MVSGINRIFFTVIFILIPVCLASAQNTGGLYFSKSGGAYTAGVYYESTLKNLYYGPFGVSDRLSLGISYTQAQNSDLFRIGFVFFEGNVYPVYERLYEDFVLYGIGLSYGLLLTRDINKKSQVYFGPGINGSIQFPNKILNVENYTEYSVNALLGVGYSFSPDFSIFMEVDFRHLFYSTRELSYRFSPIAIMAGFRLI